MSAKASVEKRTATERARRVRARVARLEAEARSWRRESQFAYARANAITEEARAAQREIIEERRKTQVAITALRALVQAFESLDPEPCAACTAAKAALIEAVGTLFDDNFAREMCAHVAEHGRGGRVERLEAARLRGGALDRARDLLAAYAKEMP